MTTLEPEACLGCGKLEVVVDAGEIMNEGASRLIIWCRNCFGDEHDVLTGNY